MRVIRDFKTYILHEITRNKSMPPSQVRKQAKEFSLRMPCEGTEKAKFFNGALYVNSGTSSPFSRSSQVQFCTDSSGLGQNSKARMITSLIPPTNLCCEEGCVNCVWIEYVDSLMKEYAKKNLSLDIEDILKEVDKEVDDPNIRAYIKLEIKSKFIY